MKKISMPIIEGKYSVLFPEKCVYCGEPATEKRRQSASAGSRRRRRSITVEVPYCTEHARTSKRNAAILTAGFVLTLLLSCCVLFAATTTFMAEPAVELMLFLALVAFGLAFGGRWVLRRVGSQMSQSMADMAGGSHLGLRTQLAGDEIAFTFVNDQMAEEFIRLNSQG